MRSWIALLAITRELGAEQASVREILSLPKAAKGPAFDVALDLSQLNFEPRVSAPVRKGSMRKGSHGMQVHGYMVYGGAAERPGMPHLHVHGGPPVWVLSGLAYICIPLPVAC